jgi:predicted nucleotidyltransferase
MDIESLLKSLRDHAVDFVVIGAVALPVHGFVRATQDVDVFIRPVPDNARRTLEALRAFGYDVTDLTVEDLLTKKVLIRQYIVAADIHPFVAGITFEEVWQHKVDAMYKGAPAFFASLDDLIRMKEAAGRPKDLEDLKVLREIKKRLKEQAGTR